MVIHAHVSSPDLNWSYYYEPQQNVDAGSGIEITQYKPQTFPYTIHNSILLIYIILERCLLC